MGVKELSPFFPGALSRDAVRSTYFRRLVQGGGRVNRHGLGFGDGVGKLAKLLAGLTWMFV